MKEPVELPFMSRTDIKALKFKIDTALDMLDVAIQKVSMLEQDPEQHTPPSSSIKRKFEPGTKVWFFPSGGTRLFQGVVQDEIMVLMFTEDKVICKSHSIAIIRPFTTDQIHIQADLVFETKEELLAHLDNTANEKD
jgi:hypothetical protein